MESQWLQLSNLCLDAMLVIYLSIFIVLTVCVCVYVFVCVGLISLAFLFF